MADSIRNVDGVRTPDNLKSVVRSKEDREEKPFEEFLKDSGKDKQEDQPEQAPVEDKLILSDREGSEKDEKDGDNDSTKRAASSADDDDDSARGIDIVA